MMTCDEIARIWPEQYPRPDAETTRQNGRMIRKFGRDFAGRDPSTIERFEAREWALANMYLARFVRSMFNDLVGDGILEENVFAGLKLPRVGAEPIVVPTISQIAALVERAAADGNWELATRIEFAAFVGLRDGEQRAVVLPGREGPGNLFDLETAPATGGRGMRRMQIDWQIGRDGRVKSPKTKRGFRSVLIPERARMAVAAAVTHRYASKSDWLWPRSRRLQGEAWTELRREAGIWFKWHDLRHFCATWLLDCGATVDDVAVQLGCHPAQIRDTYGHPDAERALGRLELLVGDA